MQKRIIAGLITGLITANSQAVTLYENKEQGAKLDLTGSLRMMLENSSKRGRADGDSDSKLKDQGTRIGLKFKRGLGDQFESDSWMKNLSAIAYFEYGGDTQAAEDNFHFDNRQSYGGLSYKGIGELDFGRVKSPFDYVHQSDYSYEYGSSGALYFGGGKIARVGGGDNNFIKRESNTIRFMSERWHGLKVATSYTMQTGTNINDIDNAWAMALLYDSPWDLTLNAGIAQQTTNGSTDANVKSGYTDVKADKENIWGIGMKYNIPQINLSLALDYGGYQIKNGNKGSSKGYTAYQDTINVDLFGAGAKWTWDKWGIYGVYGLRDGDAAADNYQETRTIFGTDYTFNKQFILWLEYCNMTVDSDDADDRYSDDKIALGARYYF
ncbi:TPA: porin [Klebsiella pneumoniae]|nr:porin [Klebsiella pneumoniae]HCB0114105.1 porin [Klebsiella pneumoniae]HED9392293.1 porin [Klebsiella pneumoniae]